jgi:hypothetical protein
MSKRIEWDALGEQGQYRMCIGCIVKAARARGIKADPLEHVGATWERVAVKVDAWEDDLPLLVWKCADAELHQVKRHERKAAACADFEIEGADGDALGSILDTVAGVGSVENEAVLRVDFARFHDALDAVNKRIVDGLALGLSVREIAPTVNMTHTAINKRVARMRSALVAEGVGA